MSTPELNIEAMEAEFPKLAGAAFAAARARALGAGLSVVESDSGVIYKVFPNGSRIVLKHIEPPTTVIIGTLVTLT